MVKFVRCLPVRGTNNLLHIIHNTPFNTSWTIFTFKFVDLLLLKISREFETGKRKFVVLIIKIQSLCNISYALILSGIRRGARLCYSCLLI